MDRSQVRPRGVQPGGGDPADEARAAGLEADAVRPEPEVAIVGSLVTEGNEEGSESARDRMSTSRHRILRLSGVVLTVLGLASIAWWYVSGGPEAILRMGDESDFEAKRKGGTRRPIMS